MDLVASSLVYLTITMELQQLLMSQEMKGQELPTSTLAKVQPMKLSNLSMGCDNEDWVDLILLYRSLDWEHNDGKKYYKEIVLLSNCMRSLLPSYRVIEHPVDRPPSLTIIVLFKRI